MKNAGDNSDLFWNSICPVGLEIDAVQKIIDGELLQVLQLPVYKEVYSPDENYEKDIVGVLKSRIEKYAARCETLEQKVELLAFGVAPLLLFIQQNWTGPDVVINDLNILNYENEAVLEKQRSSITDELVVDGENVVSIVQYPELILLSRLFMKESYSKFNLDIIPIWHLRSLFIHQQILEESSLQLFNEINNVMNEIRNKISKNEDSKIVEQYLEFARIHLYYDYVQKSKLDVERALDCSGIHTSLIGALGKRTKFQQQDLAQLTLKVDITGDNQNSTVESANEASLPVDLKLDDEVRLNKIKFRNQIDGEHPNLSGLQQAVILGIFCQTQKSQPRDRLADEELQPLISCILDKPKLWSVKLATLLFRSRIESNHKRSVERSMMQIQTLVDNIKSDDPPVKERLKHFFVSHQPPRWEIESSLAGIMMCMGAFKSALDIYLQLENWENVIHCYNVLEMRHKAQEIIEQELKKNPTPKLWCYLGDATQDPSHYETAWKLSEERSARAQRHWAMYHYHRREYDKSIEHFELSLEKNSLQSELWYRLGYAALHEEKWEVSANAYRRYCVLDPECFEAWNNLARCYCELNQQRRAWKALQEALKVDYSNWRVWDNYMLVSSELHEFDEVVRSYHQVLNLKEKHVDIPILSFLVEGFKEVDLELAKRKESDEKETTLKDLKKFREKLLTLFGRLTSQVVGQPELWHLYSEIVSSDTPQNKLKKQQLLLKAYNAIVNKKTWVKTIESCKEVIDLVLKLMDASLLVGQKGVLTSCQMSMRSCVTMIKKEHPGTDICDELDGKLLLLEEAIEKCPK